MKTAIALTFFLFISHGTVFANTNLLGDTDKSEKNSDDTVGTVLVSYNAYNCQTEKPGNYYPATLIDMKSGNMKRWHTTDGGLDPASACAKAKRRGTTNTLINSNDLATDVCNWMGEA